MVSLSIEAIAILCYTAVALFLSLYFVPFKVVPRAWAKAVRTVGHPAQVALDQVLEGAAPKVAKAVVLPDTKGMQERVDKLAEGFNAIVPLVNNLTAENLEAVMKQAYRDMRKAEVARGDTPEVNEEEAARVRQAASNPEGAETLSRALKALERLVDMGVIKAPTAKKYAKELRDEFGQSGDIRNLLKSFGIDPDALGAPSVSLMGGARSGGHSSGPA